MAGPLLLPLCPPSPDTGRSSAGWSSYGTFRECPRKFAFRDRADQYPDVPASEGEDRAVDVGTFVHALLSRYYLWKGAPNDFPDPRAFAPAAVEALANESGLVSSMRVVQAHEVFGRFLRYCEFYRLDGWVPVAVEKEYRLAIGPPSPEGKHEVRALSEGESLPEGFVLFTARLDLVVDVRGRRFVTDHKTYKRWYDDSPLNYGMTGQMHGHSQIGRAFFGSGYGGEVLNFFPVEGPEVFRREAPASAPAMVEDFPSTIWWAAAGIRTWDRIAKRARDWPALSGFFCPRCEFARACRFGVQPRSAPCQVV